MIELLASGLGRNDEGPNIELAEKISEKCDAAGVAEIVSGLKSKDAGIAADCIKVLYEIGYRRPELISIYAEDFVSLLDSKKNRLIWGGMTALGTIADIVPDEVHKHIDKIKKAYGNGSVITVDNSITVFAKLCSSDKRYMDELFPFLIKHLRECRTKEVPQHAERMLVCISDGNRDVFLETLRERNKDMTASQAGRTKSIEKALTSKNKD